VTADVAPLVTEKVAIPRGSPRTESASWRLRRPSDGTPTSSRPGLPLGVTDRVGAEVTELSPENFRQVLARARRELYSFMNDKCGLVNKSNPCRCARKTRGFIDKGYVDPKQLQFIPERLVQIRSVTPSRVRDLDVLEQEHAELFREHPMLPAPDEVLSLQRLFDQPAVRAALGADS
jgi:hypothetical protein